MLENKLFMLVSKMQLLLVIVIEMLFRLDNTNAIYVR
jgi:hypothetical protein